ncbi:MAG: hypothetical protein LQ345_000085 [Seirophora villosa]|nr:MAG: hypothetical protein LQ345_000085 [Seirophora villosa]
MSGVEICIFITESRHKDNFCRKVSGPSITARELLIQPEVTLVLPRHHLEGELALVLIRGATYTLISSFGHVQSSAATGPLSPYALPNQRVGFERQPDDAPASGTLGPPLNVTPETAWGYGPTSGVQPASAQDPFSPGTTVRSQVREDTGGRSGRVPVISGFDARSSRRPSSRDEFDGPHQFLHPPPAGVVAAQERDLPHFPTNLLVQEQDAFLSRVNDRLSQCAFDFIAKYQFPIPLEQDKRPVQVPSDREWTEWVYLLKRLATKRRIPARVLYQGQIKQLVTVLENSLEMRHAAKHQSRPVKDDRNVLQLISAGLQVAKILKDAACMEYINSLYLQTERIIEARKGTPGFLG